MQTSFMLRRAIAMALCVSVVAPMATVFAADSDEFTLEEVVVTAQKREENLQTTPIALTALAAEELGSMNVVTIGDISRVAPNVQFSGANQGFFFIRGIGQQQYGMLTDPGSTVYVDGVYRPRMVSSSTNFGDLARLEVLRGPQGTLYGKNAVGGAVNIITAMPGQTFGGKFSAQAGSRDRLKAGAAVDVPFTDTLAARVSYEQDHQDGFMNNTATGEKLSNRHYYTGSGTLAWQATDDVHLTLRADYTHQDQKGQGSKLYATGDGSSLGAFLGGGKFDVQGTSPSYINGTDQGVGLTLDWRVGSGTLKSITAYRKFRNTDADDADGTPLDAQQNIIFFDEHFFSEELQYSATAFDDALSWTTGAFYMKEQAFDAQQGVFNIVLPFQNDRTQSARSEAVFAQGTYNVTEKFSTTLGVRYSRDVKQATYNNYVQLFPTVISATPLVTIPLDRTWSAMTPRLALEYQFDPDVMSYFTVSKGFKSGGFNETPLRPTDFVAFDQEVVWNFEAGLKSEWLDRRLRANLTAFRMNYSDIQINIETPALPSNGFSPSLFVANAGDAHLTGVEGELTWLPLKALLLNVSFGYNDFQYTRLNQQALDAGITKDMVLRNAPKYNASAGVEYSVDVGNAGSLSLRADYSWRSKMYLDAKNTASLEQKAYGLLGGRATYTPASQDWSVYAYGTNLANQEFHTFGQLVQTDTVIYQGAPREVGVGITARFGK